MVKYGRWILLSFILHCIADQITYLSVEHPVLLYTDPIYLSDVTVSSRRVGRWNPVHYISAGGIVHAYVGNNVTVSFYFYEFLSNTYKRGFFEFHYKFCDFIENDRFIGVLIRRKLNNTLHCPFRPGYYALVNMTLPPTQIPKNFPFKKGRAFCNVTFTNTNKPIASAYVDVELKQMRSDKATPDLFV